MARDLGRTSSPRPARSTCSSPTPIWRAKVSRERSTSARPRCAHRRVTTPICGGVCAPTTSAWSRPTTARSVSRSRRNSASATSPRSPTASRRGAPLDLIFQGVNMGEISLERWVEVTATTPARMFGLFPRRVSSRRGRTPTSCSTTRRPRRPSLGDASHERRLLGLRGNGSAGKATTVLSRGSVIIENDPTWVNAGAGQVPRARRTGVCDDTRERSRWSSGSSLRPTPRRSGSSSWPARRSGGLHALLDLRLHVLWEEPFVIYSQILSKTSRSSRPDGHQPGHARLDRDRVALRHAQRDVRTTRTICGIGRGDSACATPAAPGVPRRTLAACMVVIKELAEGRETR
jgi:hypothetical protein